MGDNVIKMVIIPDDRMTMQSKDFCEYNESKKDTMKKSLEKLLTNFKDNISVATFKDGVRVEVMDNQGKDIFPLSSAQLTETGKIIFRKICYGIKDAQNKIIIEGHTDSLSYADNKYSNWELSTDRASTARHEILSNAVNPDRISFVAGYAATIPLIAGNPADPRNRRISLTIVFPDFSK